MASKRNKVKFNICNVHYALQQTGADGTVTFDTPVPMPGAVSLSLEANGEPSNFYADGYAYYTVSSNMGYEGDLELAMIPESFRVDVLHETLDKNKVLVENANAETSNFALLFEFDGDVKKIRHVMYNCAASRPTIESQTNEEETEVQTETLSLKASPMANGYVKAKTGDDTEEVTYRDWYKSVYMPSTADDTALISLTIGSLTLTPAFDPDTLNYTVTTNNATNTVSAVARDESAAVAITVNGAEHESGTAATWQDGENTVVATVTTVDSRTVYTVTVTKEE